MPMLDKSPPYRSEKYKKFIREQPCMICGIPSEPHHTEKAGTGLKGSDYATVNLCTIHHQELHQNGRDTFQHKYRIDFKDIIIRLLSMYVSKLEVKKWTI